MEYLRIILAGIGILIIGAIFLFGYSRSRSKRELVARTTVDPFTDLKLSARDDAPDDVDADLAELSDLVADSRLTETPEGTPIISSDSGFSTGADAASAIRDPAPLDPPEAMPNDVAREDAQLEIEALNADVLIISLHIVASEGHSFDGPDIIRAFSEIGIFYGEMQIFHYSGDDGLASDPPVYSIANMLEPGVFGSADLAGFSTTGLVVFMRLPCPIDGRVALELMLGHAQRLAAALGGELRDETHEPLLDSRIEILRERVSQFGHHQTPA